MNILSNYEIKLIYNSFKKGFGIRQTARNLGHSKDTVNRYYNIWWKSRMPSNIDWENYCSPSSKEEAHQIALFGWIADNKEYYPNLELVFAIPNGGFRNAREAGRLKAAGVKRGVSDIFVPVPMFPKCGLWVELKIGKNKLTVEQKDWLDVVVDFGYSVAVCYGWKEAREKIMTYLGYFK